MKPKLIIVLLILFVSCWTKTPDSTKTDNSVANSTSKFRRETQEDKSIVIEDKDTVQINGYTIYFTPCDSVEMPKLFEDQEFRNNLTDSIHPFESVHAAIDKYLQNKFGKYFTVTDSATTLFLDHGENLIIPKQNSLNHSSNNLENYYQQQDYFLFRIDYFEWLEWLLVNRKNGFKQVIIGTPWFSANGRKAIATNTDLIAEFSENGLQQLTISGDTLISDFIIRFKKWGPSAARWVGENEVILEKNLLTSDMRYNRSFVKMRIEKQ